MRRTGFLVGLSALGFFAACDSSQSSGVGGSGGAGGSTTSSTSSSTTSSTTTSTSSTSTTSSTASTTSSTTSTTSGTGGATTSTTSSTTSTTSGTGGGPMCTAQNAATACDDLNACTTDTCDTSTGTCAHAPLANGAACPGGQCSAGFCVPNGLGPWSRVSGCSPESTGVAVAADPGGNVIVAGTYKSAFDLGWGPIGPIASTGGVDTFVAKLDPVGRPLWLKRLGGAGDENVTGIAVDATGDVHVYGSFTGTGDFGGPMLTSAGARDAFVVKLDPAGNTLWAQRFGDAGDQVSGGIALTPAGQIVTAGGDATGMVLRKLDASGAVVWSKSFAGGDFTAKVAVDGSGKIIVAGRLGGALDLGGGAIGATDGVFVGRLFPDGSHDWSKGFPNANLTSLSALAVDAAGNIALGGYYRGTIDFGGSVLSCVAQPNVFSDMFVAKLSPSGQHLFSFDWTANQNGAFVRALAFDASGRLYVAGDAGGNMAFGGVLTAVNGPFLATLDAAGAVISARTTQLAPMTAIALGVGGHVIATGALDDIYDLGSGRLFSCVGDAYVADLATGTPADNACAVDAHCAAGEACVSTYCTCTTSSCPPEKITHVATASGQIALDSGQLYLSGGTSNASLYRVRSDGGNPYLLAGMPIDSGVAVDATDVYFCTVGAVKKAPKAGGAATTIATFSGAVSDIAVDATDVFWTDFGNGKVWKAPKAGGAPTQLASGQAGAHGIALDAANVYFTAQTAGNVVKVPKAGGAATILASGQQAPFGIALDASFVYWTNYFGGAVMRAPLAGGAPATLASGLMGPAGVAVDASNVYWSNYSAGSVMKAPLAGGAAVTLAAGLTKPQYLALDAVYLYAATGDGTLTRIPK